MAKIAEAFVDISARTDRLSSGLRRAVGMTRVAGFALGAAVLAGITKSVKAYAQREVVSNRLQATLRSLNEESELNLELLQGQARAIQRVTTLSDEQVLVLFTQLRQLGVQNRSLKEAAQATIGLSRAMGISQQRAAKLIASGEKWQEGLRGFSLAEAEVNTLAGAFQRLDHAVANLGESFTAMVAGAVGGPTGLNWLADQLHKFGAVLEAWANSWLDVLKALWNRTAADLKVALVGALTDVLGVSDFQLRFRGRPLGRIGNYIGSPDDAAQDAADAQREFAAALRRFIDEVMKAAGLFGPGGGTGIGPGSAQVRGIVNTIQTATGTFRTGQMSLSDRLLKESQENNEWLERIDRTMRRIDNTLEWARQNRPAWGSAPWLQ